MLAGENKMSESVTSRPNHQVVIDCRFIIQLPNIIIHLVLLEILAPIVDLITSQISKLGYGGILLLMILENP